MTRKVTQCWFSHLLVIPITVLLGQYRPTLRLIRAQKAFGGNGGASQQTGMRCVTSLHPILGSGYVILREETHLFALNP